MILRLPISPRPAPLIPYTPLFRSDEPAGHTPVPDTLRRSGTWRDPEKTRSCDLAQRALDVHILSENAAARRLVKSLGAAWAGEAAGIADYRLDVAAAIEALRADTGAPGEIGRAHV